MVRFHWFIGDSGHAAWVPMGGVTAEEDKGVRHVTVDMEVGGCWTLRRLVGHSACQGPGCVSRFGIRRRAVCRPIQPIQRSAPSSLFSPPPLVPALSWRGRTRR